RGSKKCQACAPPSSPPARNGTTPSCDTRYCKWQISDCRTESCNLKLCHPAILPCPSTSCLVSDAIRVDACLIRADEVEAGAVRRAAVGRNFEVRPHHVRVEGERPVVVPQLETYLLTRLQHG